MSADYQLEPMRAEDFDAVVGLWRNCEGVGLSESDTRENIAAYLARNPGMSLVARKNGQIVGAVLCGHDGRRGYLHHLAVAREHRHHGLGRKLMEQCFVQLEKINIPKCNVFVYADNVLGQSFWKQNGWMQRRDLLVMQKVLLQRCGTT